MLFNFQANTLNLVTKALTGLLQSQPSLIDLIPPMGHIQGIITNLSTRKDEQVPKTCLFILNELAHSKACIDSIVNTQTVLPQIMHAMKSYESTINIACETLTLMFKSENEELVHQAIKAELIPYLLKLLDSSQSINSSNTKALIAEVLKLMSQNLTYGEQVTALLSKSSIWHEFRDQKHDLFISNTQNAGYITGK